MAGQNHIDAVIRSPAVQRGKQRGTDPTTLVPAGSAPAWRVADNGAITTTQHILSADRAEYKVLSITGYRDQQHDRGNQCRGFGHIRRR